MPKKKIAMRQKHLQANSLTLFDSEGRPRIHLDAGGKDGFACVNLFSKDGKSVQISSQSSGAIAVQVFGKRQTCNINIGITPEGLAQLWISDKTGKRGSILGEEPGTSTHRLLLFKSGKHFWNTPSGKGKRAASR